MCTFVNVYIVHFDKKFIGYNADTTLRNLSSALSTSA